jgi:hypothetical protein
MKNILIFLYVIGFLKLISSFFFNEYVPLCLKTGVFSAVLVVLIIVFELVNRIKR